MFEEENKSIRHFRASITVLAGLAVGIVGFLIYHNI